MEQAASITTSNLLGIGWLSEINLTGNSDADWRRKVACACATRMESAGWPPHNAPRRIRLAQLSRGAKVGACVPHPFGFWFINGGPVMVNQKSVHNNVRSEKKVGQTFLSVPDISVSLALRREPVLREQMHRHLAQVPDDAEPGENLQRVVGNVDLPPEETLARRGHEVMMVVVPAFAERQQGEQPVVLAGVTGFIAPRAEEVRERIDGEGVMPQQHGAQAEAPDEERPSADQPQHHGECDGRHQVVLVQPAQLGKL